jgi:hypothetical protein
MWLFYYSQNVDIPTSNIHQFGYKIKTKVNIYNTFSLFWLFGWTMYINITNLLKSLKIMVIENLQKGLNLTI